MGTERSQHVNWVPEPPSALVAETKQVEASLMALGLELKASAQAKEENELTM